ncbi:hypothetical protein CC85DRAFT_304925 [Cutaneotrichosporon oleaginosum]|uniref:Uncharacterized protein n=1 Tax=Cutaneotrichosporon oleaginosum TaxID=879819 RepID=A0A0J1AW97_9TREE|nr:uncharacterized protein CC85DRAFT_304925 [Cutaneotrichosporon oleaginosum]KLT39554.1 hypothetical protein CC85DRAFT_304925 [Cutaneotrichosporon oleaginosum]TXT08014.1 hypothetical protein COLE_04938 [Cutaneotrichosporon oleaginosum]
MPNVASDQVTTQIQALAAHVGLDVHFTPKLSRADAPTKTSTATPEPGGPEDPKFDLPGTLSSSKSSRRASFATLLPTARVAPPKRSQAGQWTLEKRLIFVDRLITAGYKSLSLADLADELGLKKKQLVNQLTPGRTGSIRELCMNAAARILDPCSDCKKKQTSSKRKADREGLGEFLLRGVCGDIAEEDELDGKDIEEEEDELPDERLPEASSA